MPLSQTAGDPVYSEQTIDVPMRAGEQPASIQVMHEWLTQSDASGEAEALLDRVAQSRAEVERIASEKYDRGDFKIDNGVVVVRIRSGD